MSSRLDRIVRVVAMTAIAALLFGTYLVIKEASRYQGWGFFVRPARYLVGDQFDIPVVKSAQHTVVVFGRSTCSACQTAQPFIREIAADVKARPRTAIMLIDVTGQIDAAERTFAIESGIDPSAVRTVPARQLAKKVQTVPLVVVVAAGGRIEFTHHGTPTSRDVADIRALLAR